MHAPGRCTVESGEGKVPKAAPPDGGMLSALVEASQQVLVLGVLPCMDRRRPEGAVGAEALGVSGTLLKASAISCGVRPFFSRKERLESTGELRTCSQSQAFSLGVQDSGILAQCSPWRVQQYEIAINCPLCHLRHTCNPRQHLQLHVTRLGHERCMAGEGLGTLG